MTTMAMTAIALTATPTPTPTAEDEDVDDAAGALSVRRYRKEGQAIIQVLLTCDACPIGASITDVAFACCIIVGIHTVRIRSTDVVSSNKASIIYL